MNAMFASLSPQDFDALVEHSFERYFETSGLFGTPESCLAMIERLKQIGVDEVACLIDFGVATDTVLDNLRHLNRLRAMTGRPAAGLDESIAALIQSNRVTHLQCTPSMARMFVLDDDTRASLRGLSYMLVGGEALPVSLAAELREAVSGELWNMYGPTETTVWSAAWKVAAGPTMLIGRPLANQQIYILDAQGQPMAPGSPGHLFIAGDGVARGYWNRASLTAERFVPNPFVSTTAARMYFTGDVARYQHDGLIEFLGRSDHQVKIRGHRIELGEIETVLATAPGVGACVVTVREDAPGDKRLVAYVVPRSQPVDGRTLRDYLASKIPEHLVPAQFVVLDALPLTPNNKIDRRRLPAPVARLVSPTVVVAQAAPASDLERSVAGVWQDVLRVEAVNVDDNFFDIGGDSLLAAQVLSVLRARVSETISLTDLFRFPTVRALSAHLATPAQPSSRLEGSADRGKLRQQAMRQRRGQGGATRRDVDPS